MPLPLLALTCRQSSAGRPKTCSTSMATLSGLAAGRSILLMTGMSVRSLETARYALATVWAWTPWVLSTTSTAPSHAFSARLTS